MSEIGQLRLLRLAAVLSLLLALVNHLLPPKAFAATQLLFDYHFGLIRRGLAGQGIDLFAGPVISMPEIYLAAALVTLSGALAFYIYLRRAFDGQVASLLLLVLALNSFAFASFIGNTGYLDGLLLLVLVAALSSDARQWHGLVLRVLAAVIGVLLHENMLPYFTVLIAFDLWLARVGRAAWPVAFLPLLAAALAVALLVATAPLVQDQGAAFTAYLKAKAGFQLDATSTIVAGRSIGDNLALMADLRGTAKYAIWVLFDGLPLLAMSLWLLWLGNRLLRDRSVATRLLLAAAILAPLSLNVVAFDVVRFGVASVLCGFIALALVLKHHPPAKAILADTLTWPHLLLVLVLNVNMFTTQVNMTDGQAHAFPWALLAQMKWLGP